MRKIVGRSSKKGFTLVELLLALSLGGFVLFAVAGMFLNILNARQRSVKISYLQKTADQSLLNMSREIRWANDLDIVNENHIKLITEDQLIRYQLVDSNIVKHTEDYPSESNKYQENINPPGVEVVGFNVYNRSAVPDRVLVEIELEMKVTHNGSDFEYQTSTTVAPRIDYAGD